MHGLRFLPRDQLGLAALLASLVMSVPCRAVGAQWRSHLDLGSVVRREAIGAPVTTPVYVGGDAALFTRWGSVEAAGLVSDGIAPARGDRRLSAGFQSPRVFGIALAASGQVATTRLPRQPTANRSGVSLRPSLRAGRVTANAHAGEWRFGEALIIPAAQELGASVAYDFGRITLGLSRRDISYREKLVITEDTTVMVAGFPFHTTTERFARVDRRYGDLEGTVDARVARIVLLARAGTRRATAATAATATEWWASVGAEVPVSRRTYLLAEVGRNASTPEQQLPRYPFVRLGLRLARGEDSASDDATSSTGAKDAGARVEVAPASGGSTVRVRGVPGRRVELLGDLSDWKPVDLVRERDAAWRLDGTVPPGTYHVVMRVDGGDWRVPPSLPTMRSEFGEAVGLLVIGVR